MSTDAYLSHIVSRMRADASFLHSVKALSLQDKNRILDVLPSVSDVSTDSSVVESSEPAASPPPARAVPPPPAAKSGFKAPWKRTSNQAESPGGSQGGYTPPTLPVAVPALPARNVPPPPAPAQDSGPRCKALWDYNGTQPDDLSFRKGDIIRIVVEENDHWWRGEINGREGLFPSNHAERLPFSPASSPGSFFPPAGPPAFPSPPSGPPAYNPAYSSPLGSPPGAPYPPNEKQGYMPPPVPAGGYLPPGQQGPAPPPEEQQPAKKNKFGKLQDKYGGHMAQSFAGGLGFGAGTAVAGEIVHSIF